MSVFLLTAAKLQIICRISPAFRAFNVNYYEKSSLFETFRPRKELLDAFMAEFLKRLGCFQHTTDMVGR